MLRHVQETDCLIDLLTLATYIANLYSLYACRGPYMVEYTSKAI